MPAVSYAGGPGPQQEMEQFASAAAHELCSALNVVAGYCHLLRDCSPDRCDDEMREFIEEIVAGVDRASRVVDDLLSYSRVGRIKGAAAGQPRRNAPAGQAELGGAHRRAASSHCPRICFPRCRATRRS